MEFAKTLTVAARCVAFGFGCCVIALCPTQGWANEYAIHPGQKITFENGDSVTCQMGGSTGSCSCNVGNGAVWLKNRIGGLEDCWYLTGTNPGSEVLNNCHGVGDPRLACQWASENFQQHPNCRPVE